MLLLSSLFSFLISHSSSYVLRFHLFSFPALYSSISSYIVPLSHADPRIEKLSFFSFFHKLKNTRSNIPPLLCSFSAGFFLRAPRSRILSLRVYPHLLSPDRSIRAEFRANPASVHAPLLYFSLSPSLPPSLFRLPAIAAFSFFLKFPRGFRHPKSAIPSSPLYYSSYIQIGRRGVNEASVRASLYLVRLSHVARDILR